jgi:hypothetical protein
MQRRLEAAHLPDSPLDAATAFMAFHLEAARALLDQSEVSALAIILPSAGHDHDDWRRTLARDLAREAAPKRVNIVAGPPGAARDETLRFLSDAPGVTGQYCPCHD